MNLTAPSRRALLTAAATLALASTLPAGKEAAKAGWWPRFASTANAAPVLNPGVSPNSYTNRDDLQSSAGTYNIFGRPEYGYRGQVGLNSDAGKIASVPHVVMSWVWPSATDTIMQGDLEVQVTAFCVNELGLRNGVSSVEFWANGVLCTVLKQNLVSVPLSAAQGGGSRKLPAYKVLIPFAAIANGTRIEMYARGFPTAAMAAMGMQPHTIGPMFVTRKAAFDADVLVDATATPQTDLSLPNPVFNTFKDVRAAALTWSQWPANADKFIRARFAPTADGTIDASTFFTSKSSTDVQTSNNRTGRIYVDGQNRIKVLNKTDSGTNTYYPLAPYYSGLVIQNMTFDVQRISSFFHRSSPNASGERVYPILMNVEVYSGNTLGLSAGFGKFEYNPYTLQPRDFLGSNNYALFCIHQCYFHDLDYGGGIVIPVKVGSKIARTSGDATNFQNFPMTVVAFDCDTVDATQLEIPLPRVQLTYSGPEGQSAATYTVTGTSGTSNRTLTLYVNSQPVSGGQFVAATSPGANVFYSMDQVVQAINNLPNWQATPINQTATVPLAFMYIGTPTGVAEPTYPTPAGSYNAIGFGLITGRSQHNDYMQFTGTLNADNVTILGCYGVQGLNQTLYLTTGSGQSLSNAAIVLCGFHNSTNWPGLNSTTGQVFGVMSHLIIAACTTPDSPFALNPGSGGYTQLDLFCLFENIYCDSFQYQLTAAQNNGARVQRIFSRLRTTPAAMPTTIAGVMSSIFTLLSKSSDSPLSQYGNYTFNTADFPALARGLAVDGATPSDFKPSDFIPAGNGYLRMPQYLGAPSVEFDIEGVPFADNDMVGIRALAAAA